MRQLIVATVLLGLAAATAGSASAASMLVFKIDHVDVKISGSRMIVSANGAVTSGGWTRPHLHMKEIHIPESDTEVIEFLADPPPANSVNVQTLLPIAATERFPLPRYGAVQVKVEAQTNSVTARIP